MIMCALYESFNLVVSMFLPFKVSISFFKTSKSITHPEPMTGVHDSYITPDGTIERANFSSPTTIV